MLLSVHSLLPDVHEIVHPESALQKAASSTAMKAPHVLSNFSLPDVHDIIHPESDRAVGLTSESQVAAERAVNIVGAEAKLVATDREVRRVDYGETSCC